MITTFDSLYAGHVDMDDVGYGGTPVNDRRFPNEHLATVFDKAAGDCPGSWTARLRHLLDGRAPLPAEGYECIPNILMLSLAPGPPDAATSGSAARFNIAPMWHPLRLAEDFATVDILTGGRVVFGVGRGYHTREVETFGAPLLRPGRQPRLFEEQVEIIFKAFNEESFSHHGKYYDIPADVPYRGYELEEITLVPRPLNLPVECWQPIQGGTPRALDFMAKHGIKGTIGGGVAEGGAMDSVVQGYRDALAPRRPRDGAGRGPQHRLPFLPRRQRGEGNEGGGSLLRREPEDVRSAATDARPERGADSRHQRPEHAPRTPACLRSRRQPQAGAFLCGPPELVVEKLMAVGRAVPRSRRVTVSHPIGTPQKVILEQLEWFASEVMPAFKQRAAEPTSV